MDELQKELFIECRKSTPDPKVVAELFRLGAKPLWNDYSLWMFNINTVPIEVFKLFLDHGMALQSEDPDDQHSLIHRVSSHSARVDNRLQTMIDMVLEKFPEAINSRDIELRTPLHTIICVHGMIGAKLLLDRGADPNLRDINGYLPRDGLALNVQQSFDEYVAAISLR